METVRKISDLYYEMGTDERHEYLMGLAQMKLSGMTYKAIGGLTGYSASDLGKHLCDYISEYRKICRTNFERLEKSLNNDDQDYKYIVDPRTVHQQMCALVMGGQEVIETLKQLGECK